jgi:hypothetical protein
MSSSDDESIGSGDSDGDTENAKFDQLLLKAFRSKPITRRRKIGELSGSDDESDDSESEEDSDGDEADSDKDALQNTGEADGDESEDDDSFEIEQFSGKRGVPLFRCRLCPERGPFKTIEETKAFMHGKFYLAVLKRTLKMARASKELSSKKREKMERRKAANKDKKLAKLSEEQIQKRKEIFQAKKQRRLQRKLAAEVGGPAEVPKPIPTDVTAPDAPSEKNTPDPKRTKAKKQKS